MGAWAAHGGPGHGEGLALPLALSRRAGEGPGGLGCTGAAPHGASSSNAVVFPAKLSLSHAEEPGRGVKCLRSNPDSWRVDGGDPKSCSDLSAFTFPCWLETVRDSKATPRPREWEQTGLTKVMEKEVSDKLSLLPTFSIPLRGGARSLPALTLFLHNPSDHRASKSLSGTPRKEVVVRWGWPLLPDNRR